MFSRHFFLVLGVLVVIAIVGRLAVNFVRLRRTGASLGFWGVVGMFAILNFCVFVGMSVLLGGSALNGKVVGGQYCLGSHGRYVPVSFPLYVYSAVHGVVTIITVLAILAVAVYRALTGRVVMQFGKKLGFRGKGTV